MRIAELRPCEASKGWWLCRLEDGALLRVHEGQVVAFGLCSGLELDGETLSALKSAADQSRVREQALRLLSARPLSRQELLQKLTGRGIAPEQAEEAADWLEGLGYLDDGAYARALAERYASRGYGERKIRDELYRRGVPRAHWEEALGETAGPEEGIDAFIRGRLKGEAPDPKALKRLSDALARRGYRWEDIRAGLRRYGAELPED